MSKQPITTPSKKALYAEYMKLTDKPKQLSSFTNIKALQAAIDLLSGPKPKAEDKAVAKAKKQGAVPVAGNYVKLSSGDRAKLRRLANDGKVQHPWGNRWELTKADYDRLLGSAAG